MVQQRVSMFSSLLVLMAISRLFEEIFHSFRFVAWELSFCLDNLEQSFPLAKNSQDIRQTTSIQQVLLVVSHTNQAFFRNVGTLSRPTVDDNASCGTQRKCKNKQVMV